MRVQGPSKRNGVVRESELKSKGSLTTAAETVSKISSQLSSLPVVGTMAAGVNVVASAAASVFEWFGLSKPPTESSPMWTVPLTVPYSNTFHGVLMSSPLSTNILPLVATEPGLVGSQHDELGLYEIAKMPSLLDYLAFPVSGVFGTLVSTWPVNPQQFFLGAAGTRFGSHLGYAASFFTAWTGDICYKIVIPSTKFQTFRIAIVWSPQPITTYSEDLRQERYDVIGTTTVDFLVPWTNQNPYSTMRVPNSGDVNLNMSNGFIGIFMLTSIVNNTATVPSQVLGCIFSSGGASLRFAKYRSPILTGMTTSPQIAPTMAAQGAFGASNLGTVTNIIDEDNVVSLREIAKRRSYVGNWATTASASITIYDQAASINNMAYILRKFKFWRGAINATLLAVTPTIQYTVSREPGGNWEFAQQRVSSATQPEVQVLIPFLAEEGVYSTGAMDTDLISPSPQLYFSLIGSASSSVRVLAELTDDFSAGILQPSPIISGAYSF